MSIHFRREQLTARFCTPQGAELDERRVEVRFDPLLGNSARVAEGVRLPMAEPQTLAPFQAPPPTCPFCAGQIDRVTPRILPAISPEGRIRVGESTLFPNLVPYSQYAAVAVFSPRHWLSLHDFTPELLADNLTAALRYIRAVVQFDPRAAYGAYNINYLYPSGGSLPHPHAQIYLDPYPTTLARLQQEASERYLIRYGRSYWEDLVAAEEQRAERYLGRSGRVSWLTPFAPLGFNEVRAVTECETLLELTADDVGALASGISAVLAWYDAAGYNSFNLALYSGPFGKQTGSRITLAMITRSALLPYYRSDAMYLERLHWEAAVDLPPETVADRVRPYLQPAMSPQP